MERFRSYSNYLKERFGCKVHKVSVDVGFTCPNRDGSVARGGCIYCNNDSFVPPYARARYSMDFQLRNGIRYLAKRFKAKKFIVYFQAYTNTYSEVDDLEQMYRDALKYEDVIGLAIGTRSDCIDEEKLDMIQKISKETYVSLEYGIESVYDKTLEFMNRGHDYESVLRAIEISRDRGFDIGAHIIIGFPTETVLEMMNMSYEISRLGIDNIKIHNLHIVKNTPLYRMYKDNPFYLFSYEDYIDFIVEFIERLSPDIVVERLFTDTPKDLLVAPQWNKSHAEILKGINDGLEQRDTYQGKKYINN